MDHNAIRDALTAAMQHLQAGRARDVEAAVAPVLKAMPQQPDALFFMAIACHQQGRLDEAIDHGRKAAQVSPQNANILGTLGTILTTANRPEEAVDVFKQLTRTSPDKPQGYFALGGLLTRLGRHDEAVEAFKAMDRLGSTPQSKLNLANALYEAQRYTEARDAARLATQNLPQNKNAQYTLGKAELASGNPEGALTAFDLLDDGGMFQLKSLAYREVALRELGRDAEADAIGRLDDYVWPIRLHPPRGFDTLAEFNKAICDEMMAHKELEDAPTHRATRHGQKVSKLLESPSPLMAKFGEMLKGAIAEMQAHLERDVKDGPLPTSPPPGGWDIDLWVNIMHRQGHQLPHFHPQGWLSGCYYARVPECVESSGEAHEGWIEFGRPAYHLPYTREPKTRIVKPEEGLLVLFPSYLFHHTIPFNSDDKRISFAFDVVPRAWKVQPRESGAEV